MDDLISRQQAIDYFFRPYSNEEVYTNSDIREALLKLPTAEPLDTTIDDILVVEKGVDMNDINDYLEKLIDLAINVTVLFFFSAVVVGIMICIAYVTFLMISEVGLL